MVKNIIGYNVGFFRGAKNMLDEFDKVHKMKIGDEEKHRYLSCKAGQEGVGGMAAAITGGGLREMKDYYKKTHNPETLKKYNGRSGVLSDCAKDMKNNFIGSAYGVMHPKAGSCDKFLKKGK